MEPRVCILILAIIATGSCSDENNYVELLSSGNKIFTAKMFSETAKCNIDKSFVLSAFSVLTPLAQLSLASEGNSHDELLTAIGLPDDESTKSVFTYMNKKFRSVKGIDLRMASKIYVANGYSLNDNYASISKEIFQSGVKNVDFANSEKTSKEINGWVEEQTNHRIKDLVDPSSLTPDTRAVLVNAIYFKGIWQDPFEKVLTKDSDFHVTREKTVRVPMMYKKGDFNYGESAELEAKILEIPYEGNEAAFYIVLPNEIDGITELKNKLKNPSTLDKALQNTFNIEVEAYIPKFKIETTTDLNEILPEVGVNKIFIDGQANLNKLIKNTGDLYISKAIQKAFIEINEEGTEAAAANAFIILESLYLGPETLFVANKPFFFEIRINGTSIFNGVYTAT